MLGYGSPWPWATCLSTALHSPFTPAEIWAFTEVYGKESSGASELVVGLPGVKLGKPSHLISHAPTKGGDPGAIVPLRGHVGPRIQLSQ